MSFFNRIKECNIFCESEFFKFYIKNFHIGYIKKKNLNIIKKFPEIFIQKNKKIFLNEKYNNFQKRTLAINKVFNYLIKKKIIKSNHKEYFPVFYLFRAKPLLKVQRVLGPFLGLQFFGVHLNGIVKNKNNYFMWVGKRSNAGNFPGSLDQIAAGGLPYGVSVKKNLIKESFEEANIKKKLCINAKYGGTVSYGVQTKFGFSRHIIFCYDLELPKDFIPKNNDGEIEKFYFWPLEKILNIIKNSKRFKYDCAMVIINYALRKQILKSKKLKKMLNNTDIKILKGYMLN